MHKSLVVVIAFAALSLAFHARADEPVEATATPATTQPSASGVAQASDLYLARSLGGSRFTLIDRVFVPGASSPDLVRLPDGGLLAVFDVETAPGKSSIHATRSKDQGRTWTRARPIRMQSSFEQNVRTLAGGMRRADIVRMPGGSLRMYFVGTIPDRGMTVCSATSVDGLNFKMDRETAVDCDGASDPRVGAVRTGDRVHLFVARALAAKSQTPSPDAKAPVLAHFSSRDGRKFEPLGQVSLANGEAGASFIQHAGGLRAIVTLKGELRSVVSRDGKDWKLEKDLLLSEGRHPSIVEMRDGTYLLAVEIPRVAGARRVESPPLVAMTKGRAIDPNAKPGDNEAIAQAADVSPDTSNANDPASTGAQSDPTDIPNADAAQADATQSDEWEAFATEGSFDAAAPVESTQAAEAPPSDIPSDPAHPEPPADVSKEPLDGEAKAEQERLAKERDEWLAVPDVERPPIETLPPLPDFTTPVNYAEWYARLCDTNTPDNAYWAYDEFMPGPLNPDRQKEWPALDIMYNRADYTEPAPWDPAKLPDWEASYQASQPLLEKFQVASTHWGFARPVQFRPEDAAESPTGQPLLVGLLLPDLASHRALVKQTLGANWRISDDGKPSPERMMAGWQTSLSSARHMHQGATLIEQLVGTAEQNLVQSDARHALKQGVFKGKQLELALDVLEQNDHDDFDAARSMQGEHAFVLDLMQAMFKSEKPGDPPRPSVEAIDKVMPQIFGEESKDLPEIKKMTPADVKKTLNAFETYYAEASNAMEKGYPEVRSSDLDQMAKKHIDVSPLTHALLPAFGRIQKTRARNEASRRATQLSYAVHIYKEQNGRWPQSLAELPERFSPTMRTDPFTGGQFGYRVDENGPVIYSLSENGVDDGGRHSTRWDDEKNGESDDHVFWPPQPK